MNTTVRFLCSSEGNALCVQMSYDEYERLKQVGFEAALLHNRRKQAVDMLTSGKSKTPPEPAVEPRPVPTARETPAEVPSVRMSNRSGDAEFPVAIPPVLQTFLNEQDTSENTRRLIETCVRKLSGLSGKRITLSLHKPYICLWDFDAWITFAYGEIIQGNLFLSIDRALMPDAGVSDAWTPPSGLTKKPLVRMKVEAVTDTLIDRLQRALAHNELVVEKTGS